jgi:hypothetical protein
VCAREGWIEHRFLVSDAYRRSPLTPVTITRHTQKKHTRQLPFPSGTATGVMLESFHSKTGEAAAMKKVKALLWTSLASFVFEAFKWVYQGSDYSCGFGTWPLFGFVAKKWTFFFDWNQT